ncbi:MAG: nitrogenase molybdenum-iron protein subunit beta [Dactylosporangium sp.]|nr:nitrogenase molybdenum-iron protein subunit beta [Dactylosporangium sp.]
MTLPCGVCDHTKLFDTPLFTEQFARKREFEAPTDPEELARVTEWTRGQEYREQNFAREALVVNPAKACQPLGAVLAALGFAGTLPLVHGSQGCVAYFRSHLTRHFKEPTPVVSSSMTEDAAVFGGLTNLVEALDNATALYQPDMVAVSTTCMAEVIGDDLQNFITTARQKGAVGDEFPVPFAHTPSFVGSHLHGYDVMLRGILGYLTKDRGGEPNGKINIVPGFASSTGDLRELRRILTVMGVACTMLGDHSDAFDSPATGEYDLYPGGTSLEEAADAINALATVFLQESTTRKTTELVREEWGQETVTVPFPLGIANTDRFVMDIARLAGVPVPDALTTERGRLIDAMADSHAYLHGKRVAVAGDPDLVVPLLGFLLELGMEPVHVVSTTGDAAFRARAEAVLAGSPFGGQATVWPGKDLWHLRSLVFTEPVDLLIGSSHLKYLAREADVPLVRIGFPIFDRHHLHRFPTIGYAGGVWLLAQLVNTVLDELDRAPSGRGFDLVR